MTNEELNGLTQEKREKLTLDQGNKVYAILNSPGWKIIENIILLTRSEAEEHMEKDMRMQSTREKAVYWAGYIGGTLAVRRNISKAVQAAIDIANKEAVLNAAGGLDA